MRKDVFVGVPEFFSDKHWMITDFSVHYQVLQDLLPLTLLLLVLLSLSLNQRVNRVIFLDQSMHVLLEASHFANDILNYLGRELLKDLVLGPSQYERCYPLFEALKCLNERLSLL